MSSRILRFWTLTLSPRCGPPGPGIAADDTLVFVIDNLRVN
jgi:hypothetical protein